MMKKYLLFIIGSIFIYACPSLPDDHVTENCNGSFFPFTIPVSFEPKDASIKTGDTININCEFPANMWDDTNSEQLIFDSIDFYMRGAIYRLDTMVNEQYDFLSLFDVLVDTVYKFKKNYSAFAFDFRYQNNKYDFSIKLVPHHKGIYIFKFYSEYELHFNKYTPPPVNGFNSDCYTDAWTVYFPASDGDTHIELLNEVPYEDIRNWYHENWSRIELSEGGYLFKVE